MTLRSDSYSTAVEVTAWTRHLLDGQSSFNSTTRPSGTELDKFIDRASGVLNVALSATGLAVPITNSTAKLACDDWVSAQAAQYVEMTQRGGGYSDAEGSRTGYFKGLYGRAKEFADAEAGGMRLLGCTLKYALHDGLISTGQPAISERIDDEDETLRQPIFTRARHSDPTIVDSEFAESEE